MPLWPLPLFAASSGSDNIPGADLHVPAWAWVATVGAIIVMVAADLLILRRQEQEVTLRSAALGTAVWVAIGLAFAVVVWATLGGAATGQYLTGYVIEESLSVDNVFVWAVIFGFFAVPAAYHRRVLFWGIFGALVFRAIFIFAGVALLERFSWIEIIFGAFLVITAWRIAFHDETEIDPDHNPIFRLARRIVPVTEGYRGQHMFVREAGKRFATPLFLVLIFVELTDVVFAVDSVPAVLAVSRSQFIVFTSNAFAILGLRAIYFLLAGAKDALVHLNVGLGIILAFVGIKMLVSRWFHINTYLSLAVIIVILTITVIASLRTNAHALKLEESP
jgi:tellurite resistance protein TerC